MAKKKKDAVKEEAAVPAEGRSRATRTNAAHIGAIY